MMKQANQFLSVLLALLVLLSCCGSAQAQGLSRLLAGGGPAGICGDGGRAAASCLLLPTAVTLDPAGNRYIADTANHRVRKITPGQVIGTFAGIGAAGFSGDNGPASRASFRSPTSVAFEPTTGSLYILDSGNNRIRRVTPDGIVTTIAGDGRTTFAGDNGPAKAASISTGGQPAGLLWTPIGLYLTDTGNHRIRRINPNGMIVTVAGTGNAGFSGDSGAASEAALNQPGGTLALDGNNNLYFADSGNHRVRRISPPGIFTPSGIISTVAGISTGGFTGDGGPSSSAALSRPLGVSLDRASNLYIADTGNNRIRRITPNGVINTVAGGGASPLVDAVISTEVSLQSPAGVTAGPLSLLITDTGNSRVLEVLGAYARPGRVVADPLRLEFEVILGTELPDPERLFLFSPDLVEFAFGARVSTVSGGNWLSLRPVVGFTPGAFQVSVNPARLAAGTYQGSISFTVPQATNSPVSVPVTMTIVDRPARLAVFPDQLSFSAPRGSNPPGQVLRIANRGGGTFDWTATVLRAPTSPLPAGAVNLSASSGRANTEVRVAVNSSSLAPGSYQSGIQVRASTGESVRIPVNVQVASSSTVLQTSQSGLIFIAVEGSGALPTRNFNVVNAGAGDMSWTIAIQTITGGNWLTLSPTSGASTGGQAPPQVVLTANATGLRAGAYHAVLRVSASGAANSPQFVHVVLNLLPPGTTPPPQPSPSGLLFLANAGGAPPAAQVVRVFAGGGAVTFNASTTELDNDGWLSVDPTTGTGSATAPTEIRVSVDPSGLTAGTYRGLVNVGLSDGSTRSVNVLLVVAPPGTLSASTAATADDPEGSPQPVSAASGACTPANLAVVHTGLVSNFASPVGWPIPLVVRVTDDCGASQINAAVVTSFSNGDPALTMANLKNGQYSATWMPVSSTSRVTITSTAVASGLQQATAQINGSLSTNAVPVVYRGGAVQAASFAKGAPLAPGSIFSAFGANLAPGDFQATQVPLPKELGGLSATLGNLEVPLIYAGNGQFNAQVPAELPANSTAQLVVKVGNAFTVPESINISAVQPGIFTQNQSGTGPGAILDVRFNLVTASNPVRAGDVIQIFGTGFGETNPAVPSGQPAPATEPLARVTRTVTATVAGINAQVVFAGLAPNFVGLNQINVQIPSGVGSGEVNLVLTQDGIESNTVTVFVRQ